MPFQISALPINRFEHLFGADGELLSAHDAKRIKLEPGEVPEQLRIRLLSVRAFDDEGMMIDADVVEGTELEHLVDRMFAKPLVRYLHIHHAKPGCYGARVDRSQ